MPAISIVLSSVSDWKPYYPATDVVEVDQYLAAQKSPPRKPLILNLCRHYRYLSHGYYCSLLAESRGQAVIPSIRTINSLSEKSLYVMDLTTASKALEKLSNNPERLHISEFELTIYFGQTEDPDLKMLARSLFDRFPCPILQVRFKRRDHWLIDKLSMRGLQSLNDEEQTHFAEALDRFSRKIWRKPRAERHCRYDLAVLVNPDEAMPPSDKKALSLFKKAAREESIDVELITKRDFARLAEFDALFIRETTSIDNHTYRFARRAESLGCVVIDDTQSILRCTNKVYLANLLAVNHVPTPQTLVLNRHRAETLLQDTSALQYPIVLKIPDGSFSRGVEKAVDSQELVRIAKEFFARSALILAQEFYPTDFDWRIGVLNGKALFACQYFMSRGHWQIYKHGKDGRVSAGNFKTIGVESAPENVIKTALAATRLIGNGFYGVDLKQRGEDVVIIEINDNPNIDSGVEDKHLGKGLYQQLAAEFRRRLDEGES